MAESELEYLALLASKALIIAEIGSWQGRSTRAFADNTEGFVICTDTWADNAYGSAPAEMTCHPEWLWNAFKANTADLDNVVTWRMNSVDGAARAKDHRVKFDLIFIDAGHNYEDITSDIEAWRPHLRPGGVFCGHDYSVCHRPVMQAVEELVKEFTILGTIWTAK